MKHLNPDLSRRLAKVASYFLITDIEFRRKLYAEFEKGKTFEELPEEYQKRIEEAEKIVAS
jgi:TRAP-type C4-dicarboxylate transport system substrate-binding protein